MYVELKSINVWTMIKTWFFLNLVIGLGVGLAYSIISLVTLTAATEFLLLQGIDPSSVDPFTLVILMPILCGCGNAIFGTMLVAVLSIVYNITGRLFGGLQFELIPDEEDEAEATAEAPAALTPQPQSEPAAPQTELSAGVDARRVDSTGEQAAPPPPPPVEQAQAMREAAKKSPPPPPFAAQTQPPVVPEDPSPVPEPPAEPAPATPDDDVTETWSPPKPPRESGTERTDTVPPEAPMPPPERTPPKQTETPDEEKRRNDQS